MCVEFSGPPVLTIRPAVFADLTDLLAVEERCFALDRMTRRNFRYALTRAKVTALVAVTAGPAIGYILVGHHSGTDIARIYSLAIDPEFQGQGIARRLLAEAERAAAARGARRMRLEVRADNRTAVFLYRSAGYREFAAWENYYEDGMTALRLEKSIASGVPV